MVARSILFAVSTFAWHIALRCAAFSSAEQYSSAHPCLTTRDALQQEVPFV